MTSWNEVNESIKRLSIEEQRKIANVLEKDLEFHENEQQRIRTLSTSLQKKKTSIEEQRRASSIAGSTSTESGLSSPGVSQGRTSPLPRWNNRACFICQSTLGYILNSGVKCRKCSMINCEKCTKSIISPNGAKQHLCQICFNERELSAVKNEWLDGGGEPTPSQYLLNALKTSTIGDGCSLRIDDNESKIPKRCASFGRAYTNAAGAPTRAPYKRNLTLPAIQTNFLLNVPDEANGTESTSSSPKFWGGSPSPRSPRSINSSLSNITDDSYGNELRAMHPREPIGSPAPRPMSSTPLTGVPEDEHMETIEVPTAERRRSAFETTRRSAKLRRQSEIPVPTFQLSMC